MKNAAAGLLLALALTALCSSAALAQDLVYTPVNPSFGGNPYNATWLFNEAQAQNNMTEGESASSTGFKTDALSDFKESLNRQILSQLSRQLITQTFGEDALKDGHYELGDFVVDVTSQLDGISITIFDRANGAETNVMVPYF